MITAYFDSSAIMKLAHQERESQALIDYLEDSSIAVSTSVLAEVEVVRNLRKWSIDTSEAMRGFYLIALEEDTRSRASELKPLGLKALDAIQGLDPRLRGDDDRGVVQRTCSKVLRQLGWHNSNNKFRKK